MAKLNKETDIYQNITQVLCGMIWPSGAGLLAFVFSGSFTLDLLVSFLLSISLTRKVRGKINQSNQKQRKQKRVILLFQIEKFHAYLAICLGDKWVLPGFLSLPLGLLFLQVCPHPYHQSSEKVTLLTQETPTTVTSASKPTMTRASAGNTAQKAGKASWGKSSTAEFHCKSSSTKAHRPAVILSSLKNPLKSYAQICAQGTKYSHESRVAPKLRLQQFLLPQVGGIPHFLCPRFLITA